MMATTSPRPWLPHESNWGALRKPFAIGLKNCTLPYRASGLVHWPNADISMTASVKHGSIVALR